MTYALVSLACVAAIMSRLPIYQRFAIALLASAMIYLVALAIYLVGWS